VSCPDGITSKGVFLAGVGPYSICHKWNTHAVIMGEMKCDFPNGVCTKAAVRRCENMSPYAIVLLMKRIKCWRDEKNNQKCSVFKAGVCIDVGQAIAKSKRIPSNLAKIADEYFKMATLAQKVLEKYPDKLPEKYQCHDTRRASKDDKKIQDNGYDASRDQFLAKRMIMLF